MQKRISLEPEAIAVSNAAAKPPLIFQLPPEQGRQVLEDLQDSPVRMYPASVQSAVFHTGKWGKVRVYAVCPDNLTNPANVIFYIHGAGWVFGSFHTHEKLVRELAARTCSIVIFPEYSRAPEAKYPAAIEQCYDILRRLPSVINDLGYRMNPRTLTVAGDSVGGNMAIAMIFMTRHRGGPYVQKLLLYYPVTDARFDTESYFQFAQDYYLYRQGMMWFWDQYIEAGPRRDQITVSPLRADAEQLKGFPDTMILNGEADVLRSEGEAFARKLREAGVNVTAVRFQGIIHDFVMLNALDQTAACRAAMNLSVAWINGLNECNCKGENKTPS